MSDKKALLKSARDGIESKDYEHVLRISCKVLEKEDDYMALLFSGLASAELGRISDAREFYVKATKLDQAKLLAWQGIYKLYEDDKLAADESVLLACDWLLKSVKDKEKLKEYEQSKVKILLNLEQYAYIFPIVNDSAQVVDISNTVVKFLARKRGLNEEALSLCRLCLQHSTDSDLEILSSRADFAFQYEPPEVWVPIMELASESKGADAQTLEKWLLGLTVLFVQDGLKRSECPAFGERLKNANAGILDGFKCLQYCYENTYSKASEILQNLDWSSQTDELSIAFRLMALPCNLLVRRYESVSLHVAHLLDYLGHFQLRYGKLSTEIRYMEARSLYGIGTDKSLSSCIDLLTGGACGEKPGRSLLLVRALADARRMKEAWEVLATCVDSSADYYCTASWCHLRQQNWSTAKENCLKAIELDEGCGWYHLTMGLILWKSGRRDGVVLKECLSAAQTDPYDAQAFFLLGQFYAHEKRDLNRSVRCLERALALRPPSEPISLALSDVYLKTAGCETKHMELLKRMTESTAEKDKYRWARLRYGLLLCSQGLASEGVSVLQTLCRVDRDDANAWQCLADAYVARGALESAVKAYEHVVSLRPNDCVYATVRLAAIDLSIGKFESTISQCEPLLSCGNSAHVKLTRCLMTEALQRLAENLLENGRVQRSLDRLVQFFHSIAVLQTFSQASIVMKLYADGLMLLLRFGESRIKEVHDRLNNGETFKWKNKKSVLEQAVWCYCNIVARDRSSSAAWNDLAQALIILCELGVGSKALVDQSVRCSKKAVASAESDQLKSRAYVSWSLAEQKRNNWQLAQHCLVRALQLDKHNLAGWSHLGLLYLIKSDTQLSHQAFCRAQSLEPSAPIPWCAQAMIADMYEHHDAADLFRHTVQLSNLPIAGKMCAYFCLRSKTSGESDGMASETVLTTSSFDALQNLEALGLSDFDSLCLLGLFLEDEGFFNAARSVLNRISKVDEITRQNKLRLDLKLEPGGIGSRDVEENQLLKNFVCLSVGNADQMRDLLFNNCSKWNFCSEAEFSPFSNLYGHRLAFSAVYSSAKPNQHYTSKLLQGFLEFYLGNRLVRETFVEVEDGPRDGDDGQTERPVLHFDQTMELLLLLVSCREKPSKNRFQMLMHKYPWQLSPVERPLIARFCLP